MRSARFEHAGAQVFEISQGEPCCAVVEVYFHAEARDPIFAMALQNERGQTAFAASTQLTGRATGVFGGGSTATVRLRFDNWLAPGRYSLMASIARAGARVDAYDARQDISSIIVHASHSGGGAVDLPHNFEIERQ